MRVEMLFAGLLGVWLVSTVTACGPQPDRSAGDDDDAGIEECVDEDGDGICLPYDCDDLDPAVRPNTAEQICDDLDNDCDPSTEDAPDEDGDGATACSDCDDDDSLISPSLVETLCDGFDNDCDEDTLDAPDVDEDGHSACDDCDDENPFRYPGAPPACAGEDSDCDGDLSEDESASPGSTAGCAVDGICAELLDALVDPEDGVYWVGDEATAAFRIACTFEDGRGWLHLEVTNSQHVFVASNSPGNSWLECADDAAAYFDGIGSEDEVVADHDTGNTTLNLNIAYRNPTTEQTFSGAQMDFLRARVVAYHSDTRMVAVTADDDGWDLAGGATNGHEVYVQGDDLSWINLSPGTNGECGGSSNWPAVGSESAFYVWHPNPGLCEAAGDTGGVTGEMLGGLTSSALLPLQVRLQVQTGGGVAFGWRSPAIVVR